MDLEHSSYPRSRFSAIALTRGVSVEEVHGGASDGVEHGVMQTTGRSHTQVEEEIRAEQRDDHSSCSDGGEHIHTHISSERQTCKVYSCS